MLIDLLNPAGTAGVMRYALVTAPTGAIVDLARACRHLRLEEADADDVEQDLIEAAIAAATGHLDGRAGTLNRALLTQTWRATADRPAPIAAVGRPGFVLDLAPVQAVTAIEVLTDRSYVPVPPASWRTVAMTGGATAVIPTPGRSWPAADADPEAWRLTFRAGYGDEPDAVPAPIRAAILLMVSDLYDNRDGKQNANAVDNPTIERLLAPYRRVGV